MKFYAGTAAAMWVVFGLVSAALNPAQQKSWVEPQTYLEMEGYISVLRNFRAGWTCEELLTDPEMEAIIRKMSEFRMRCGLN